MIKIYSEKEPGKLLHIINKRYDFLTKRVDLVNEDQYLQVSCQIIEKEKIFPAHIHKNADKQSKITQECIIVISGKVKVSYYDIDKTFIDSRILEPGDCTITLYGGHKYETIERDTKIYEIKTGPYYGQSNDKEFFEDAI